MYTEEITTYRRGCYSSDYNIAKYGYISFITTVRGALLDIFSAKEVALGALSSDNFIIDKPIKAMQIVMPINWKHADWWVGVLLLYTLMNT